MKILNVRKKMETLLSAKLQARYGLDARTVYGGPRNMLKNNKFLTRLSALNLGGNFNSLHLTNTCIKINTRILYLST